jgi:DNA-3-methyladenine glycosylase I
MKEIIRCSWCWTDPLYVAYHDTEWWVPVHDDRLLFEFLTLEWAQAGLSWITVLRKCESYREHFHKWDIEKIANMSDIELEDILLDAGVVRNRLKIYSVRKNAHVALEIQKEFGSLDAYFWGSQWLHSSPEKGRSGGVSQKGIPHSVIPSNSPFSGGELPNFPIIHHGTTIYDFPTEDDISRTISKDLKKRGMSFVGSTIIYAFMQAVGMVDDHIEVCFRKTK